jgi:hypothetical protein
MSQGNIVQKQVKCPEAVEEINKNLHVDTDQHTAIEELLLWKTV